MRWAFILAVILLMQAGLLAQSTQPAATSADVELRATEAFNRGEYSIALPLLKKLAGSLEGQADRLGPVEERIRVCQKNLAAPELAPQPAVLPGPNDGPPSEEQRKPHPAPKPGQVQEMAIKDLGNFQYDAAKGGNIPPDVQRLTGSLIRLHGFMIPMDQADNITEFALVPSLFSCCFGQPPQVQHTVVVNCPKGKAVSYCPDEITVEGKLTVDEKKDDGYIISIFQVEAGSVRVIK